jgi:hypothetical protein
MKSTHTRQKSTHLTHFPIHCAEKTSIKEIEVQLRYPLFHTFSGLLFFHGVVLTMKFGMLFGFFPLCSSASGSWMDSLVV